jgi:hypothetical protein
MIENLKVDNKNILEISSLVPEEPPIVMDSLITLLISNIKRIQKAKN